jgi:hypothetical protein
MTEGPSVALTHEGDYFDEFQSAELYDIDGCLERAGSINVVLLDNDEGFQIELLDGVFRDRRRALRKGVPGIIQLSETALFAEVQKCRNGWVQALRHAENIVLDVDGKYRHSLYDDRWDDPVDPEIFDKIGCQLARAGARLFETVFERNSGTPLDKIAEQLRKVTCDGDYAFTVNASRFHLPWSMLYTHPDPKAKLAPDGSNFDKRGFWGYRHIFEQFTDDLEINDHLPVHRRKLGFAAALNPKVDEQLDVECIARHKTFVQEHRKRLRYKQWTNRSHVERGLSAIPFRYQIVYFLCHGKGAGDPKNPALTLPSLELTDGEIDASDIGAWIKQRFGGNQPLVFINACHGGQLDTLVYHNFTLATAFLKNSAACVVGPQIEVPAVFAGEFGKRFFDRFIEDATPPPRAGLILRDLVQEMWDRRNPFGLVYSLYAGADCHIRWA